MCRMIRRHGVDAINLALAEGYQKLSSGQNDACGVEMAVEISEASVRSYSHREHDESRGVTITKRCRELCVSAASVTTRD